MSDGVAPARIETIRFLPGEAGTPGGGPESSESAAKFILLAIGLVRRNVWLILACGLIGLGIGLYRVRNDRPTYLATAVLRVADRARALSGGITSDAPTRATTLGSDPVLTQIQILRSRGVAREVVQREGLRIASQTRGFVIDSLEGVHTDSTVRPQSIHLTFSSNGLTARSGAYQATVRYGDTLRLAGVSFVLPHRPAQEQADLVVLPTEAAIDGFLANLRAAARERTNIVDVSYVSTDPQWTAAIVNSAVTAFSDVSVQTAKRESMRRRQFIESQLEKTNALLSEAQLAHNRFRAREHVYSSQEKFRAQQTDMFDLELRNQELRSDRQIYKAVLDSLQQDHRGPRTPEGLGALLGTPGLGTNQAVTQLINQLSQLRITRDSLTGGVWGASTQNPDVRRVDALIATTESNIIGAVRGQLAAIDTRLAALDSLRKRAVAEMAGLPTAEAEESSLIAQVSTYEREAERLRGELQKAQIDEAAEGGQVEIIDLASAGQPIGSGRRSKVLFALLLGFAAGAGLSYILENRNSVVRKREDLENNLGVPTLAMIPRHEGVGFRGGRFAALTNRLGSGKPRAALMNGNSDKSLAELVTITNGRSTGAEAYRTLRTNLMFSAAVQSIRQVVITSASPQEGKSTTAANLAITLAQQGRRVLLIDCDLRRPRVHGLFECPQSPGLTNVLLGIGSFDEIVRSTPVEGLSVLTAGSQPPNPAELLGSVQLQEFLRATRDRFDVILLDTPPMLAASDAAILGRISDGAIVVVRAGLTERSAVRHALEQLMAVGTRVLGTVLNDPDAEVAKYAAYGSTYYNNYYDYSAN